MEHLRPTAQVVAGWHSPDCRWWWDGWAWRSALTPNRRYWFTGSRWVRWRNGRPSRGGLSVRGAVWLTVCAAWLPIAALVLTSRDGNPTRDSVVVAAIVAGVGLLVLPAGGLVLARDREPWRFWVLWLAGTGANLVGYLGAMLTVPDQPGQDDAAGAGLVILSVPVAVTIAALIALGLGIGLVLFRRRQTR